MCINVWVCVCVYAFNRVFVHSTPQDDFDRKQAMLSHPEAGALRDRASHSHSHSHGVGEVEVGDTAAAAAVAAVVAGGSGSSSSGVGIPARGRTGSTSVTGVDDERSGLDVDLDHAGTADPQQKFFFRSAHTVCGLVRVCTWSCSIIKRTRLSFLLCAHKLTCFIIIMG